MDGHHFEESHKSYASACNEVGLSICSYAAGRKLKAFVKSLCSVVHVLVIMCCLISGQRTSFSVCSVSHSSDNKTGCLSSLLNDGSHHSLQNYTN